MPKTIDVKPGDRYSRLKIINEIDRIKKNRRSFLCVCDCGNEIKVTLHNLRRQHVKSCGCLQRTQLGDATRKHGMYDTRIYRVWAAMKRRCLNERSKAFKNYGGRGIKIYEPWLEFNNFLKWAKRSGYSDELTIERIDNNGNYEPSNCRWATPKEQSLNRRNTVIIERNGMRKPLREWCDIEGVSFNLVYKRIKRGWDIEEAINKPPILQGHKYAN